MKMNMKIFLGNGVTESIYQKREVVENKIYIKDGKIKTKLGP